LSEAEGMENGMIGLGTIINAAAVVGGGLAGMIIKKGLKQRFQDTLTQALGLAVIFIGISGTLQELFVVQKGEITTEGTMMMVVSLVLGALLGEWINIEKHTEQFGAYLKRKVKSENDSGFIEGFVVTSLTICVGAMAIVGALQDGLTGDYSMLVTKAILDAVIVVIFAASFGVGAIFSVIPLTILQGSVTLFARFIQPFMTENAISNLSLVGNMLIFCVGVNLMFKAKIKVANMLPALIFVVLCGIILK